MPQARSSGSGSGSSSGRSQSRRSTSSSSSGGRSTGSRRTTRSSSGSGSSGTSAKSTRARSTRSGASSRSSSSRARSARSATGAAAAAQSAVASDPRVEAVAQRIRKLNERIIDASKDMGEATLSSYERALKAIAGSIERGPGHSEVEWISSLATTQAKFIRDVTNAWTSAARGMLK
jgi:hypothetical protein